MNASQNIWSLSLFSQLNKLIEQWKYTFLVLEFNACVCRWLVCLCGWLSKCMRVVCMCVWSMPFLLVTLAAAVAFNAVLIHIQSQFCENSGPIKFVLLWTFDLFVVVVVVVMEYKNKPFNLYFTCLVWFDFLPIRIFFSRFVIIIKCKNLSTSFTLVQWSKCHLPSITNVLCELLIDFKWIFKVLDWYWTKSILNKHLKFDIFRCYSCRQYSIGFESFHFLFHLNTIINGN